MRWPSSLHPAAWVAGLVLFCAAVSAAQSAPPSAPQPQAPLAPLARIAIDETVDAPAAVLTEKPASGYAVPLAARISTTLDALADAPTASQTP